MFQDYFFQKFVIIYDLRKRVWKRMLSWAFPVLGAGWCSELACGLTQLGLFLLHFLICGKSFRSPCPFLQWLACHSQSFLTYHMFCRHRLQIFSLLTFITLLDFGRLGLFPLNKIFLHIFFFARYLLFLLKSV